MSKTLSNGTLSLRFMQNAQRAKQQAQVEAQQAKVRDDAEWEVSQEIKDAWGIGSTANSQSSHVTHETSYLPFLFPSSPGDSGESSSSQADPTIPRMLKGRRKFNDRGQEVIPELISDVKEEEPDRNEQIQDAASKLSKRPKTISGFQAPLLTTRQKDSRKKRTKTAQELIREDTGAGIRHSSSLHPSTLRDSLSMQPTAPSGFLKPSGVDAPASTLAIGNQKASAVSSGARLKRTRDREAADTTTTEGKRRRKRNETS